MPGDTPAVVKKNKKAKKQRKSSAAPRPQRIIVEKLKRARNPKRAKENGTALSPCAEEYAVALRDPFDGPLACVPSAFPPIPSFKTRVWAKGTISIGTQGYGFVMVAPQQCFANDASAVLVSSAAYAQTGFPTSSGNTGVVLVNTNAPFNLASIGDTPLGVQFRMVARGVRVWYTGKEIDIQGEMLGFRQPDNVSAYSLTQSQLLSFPSTRRVQITSDREAIDVTWIPTKPAELEFQGTASGVFSLGVLVSGLPLAANYFSYEVAAIGEYIGSTVPQRTPSHADPAGFAAVLTSAQQQGDSWYGDARQAAKDLINRAGPALSELSGVAMRGAGRMAMNYVKSTISGGGAFGLPSMTIGPDLTPKPLPRELGVQTFKDEPIEEEYFSKEDYYSRYPDRREPQHAEPKKDVYQGAWKGETIKVITRTGETVEFANAADLTSWFGNLSSRSGPSGAQQ